MLIYEGTKVNFLESVFRDKLEEEIITKLLEKMNKRITNSEITAI